MIGKADGGQFWDEVKRAWNQAAKDINEYLGYEGKDKVKVTYSGPAAADNVDEQVNILDEELARYPVALGISMADAKACEVQFDLAAESDIPIVAFDSGSATTRDLWPQSPPTIRQHPRKRHPGLRRL